MLETSTLTFSVTSSLWCTRGSISILMPTSWYWNDVTGTMFDPADVLRGVEGGGGDRHPVADMVRLPFSPSVIRSLGWARAWASLFDLTKSIDEARDGQQPVVLVDELEVGEAHLAVGSSPCPG